MCCGWGKFMVGMAAGMAAGTVLGMSMNPNKRSLRRAARKATGLINDAVDRLTETMDL
jgi:cyclopropane fatty-acyl-phospholipid synthase-like methyltransferase